MSTRARIGIGLTLIVSITIVLLSRSGFQKPTPISIVPGMPMNTALRQLESKGIYPGATTNRAPIRTFRLPDGRTLVLFGVQQVDSIQLIPEPSKLIESPIDSTVSEFTY